MNPEHFCHNSSETDFNSYCYIDSEDCQKNRTSIRQNSSASPIVAQAVCNSAVAYFTIKYKAMIITIVANTSDVIDRTALCNAETHFTVLVT